MITSPINWEQKLAALKGLTETHLEMRAPGNWYVAAYSRECHEGGMLSGKYGNGRTPQEAVEDDWKQIAESGAKVVINAMSRENRIEVRWNGFMWQNVKSEEEKQ